ncbi:MFS transporter [Streptomyces sp. Inha503]|uniref:MFS transporter n=1 Tax=Streptomyces sp. Inha503 TaxID=3383314 RepID=UPI00399F2264
MTGIALFGLASLACGAAPGLGTLIVARVVQGVAAAVLVPTSLSLALPAFPPRERATAIGVWTAVSAVAASSGPVAGGLLAASDWRWIFLINPPVVLVAWVAGLRAGWVFTAVTAALAAVAGAALGTRVRVDNGETPAAPGESRGSGTDPDTAPLTCPCHLPSVLSGPWVLRRQ